MTINKRKLIIILIMLMIIDIPYMKQTYNNIIDLSIQIILLIIYVSLNKNEKNSIDKGILLFSIGTIISTLINFGISTRLATAIVVSMEYVLMFFFFKEITIKHGLRYLLDVIYFFLKYLLIIVDISIILTKGRGIGGSKVLPYYLIGNKFRVSYYHMLFIGLYLYKDNLKKANNKFKFLLMLFSIYICKTINCNTGVIGCLGISILYIYGNNSKIFVKFMSNSTFYIIFLILINFLLLGTDVILKNEIVEQIVVKVLKRNMTLTGRLEMFELSWNAFLEKSLFGYGINSTYIEDVLGFGNAQNGVLKMLLDYGIIGFLLFIYVCFSSLKTKDKNVNPIIAFLYGMAICTTVEINISEIFFLGLAIVNASKYITKSKLKGDER